MSPAGQAQPDKSHMPNSYALDVPLPRPKEIPTSLNTWANLAGSYNIPLWGERAKVATTLGRVCTCSPMTAQRKSCAPTRTRFGQCRFHFRPRLQTAYAYSTDTRTFTHFLILSCRVLNPNSANICIFSRHTNSYYRFVASKASPTATPPSSATRSASCIPPSVAPTLSVSHQGQPPPAPCTVDNGRPKPNNNH
jgi:hypothetical protein